MIHDKISLFTRRFIPDWLLKRYPNLEQFIKIFFEFLEINHDIETGQQSEGIYKKINHIIDYKTIDYIINISDENLKQQLLDNLFSQLAGDKNVRYLSDTLDEVLYIKYNNRINYNKGTKSSFQLLFLLILKGDIEFELIKNIDKKHDGKWQYNGLINYDGEGDNEWGFNPFVYKVLTVLPTKSYKSILDKFNPAGFQYYIENKYIFTPDNVIFNNDYTNLIYYSPDIQSFTDEFTGNKLDQSKIFYSIYDENDDFIIAVKPRLIRFYGQTDPTGINNGIVDVGSNYQYVRYEDDAQTLAYRAHYFLGLKINYNNDMVLNNNIPRKIKLLYEPIPNNNYVVITPFSSEGTELLSFDIDSNIDISTEDNINIHTYITFDENIISMMAIGSSFNIV